MESGEHTVSVAWTVNMTVVAVVCLVLYMRRVDCDTASLLLWRIVDLAVVRKFGATSGR
jgi:hypothetical protein